MGIIWIHGNDINNRNTGLLSGSCLCWMMWTVTSFLEMHAAASVAFNRSILFWFLSFLFAVMLGLVCSLDERSVTRLAPKDVLHVKMRVLRTPVMIQLDQGCVYRGRLIATEFSRWVWHTWSYPKDYHGSSLVVLCSFIKKKRGVCGGAPNANGC